MDNPGEHETFSVRGGFSLGLFGVIWSIAPALVAGGNLYLLARLFGEEFTQPFAVLFVVVVALCAPIMRSARGPELQLAYGTLQQAVEIVIRWVILLFALLAIGFLIKLTDPFPRRVLLSWAVTTPLLIIAVGILLGRWMRAVLLNRANRRHVVIAGYNEASSSLAARIVSDPSLCMSVDGFFDDRSTERLGASPNDVLLGGLQNLVDYVKRHRVDIIFVALPIRNLPRVLDLLDDLRDTTASIYYLPDIFMLDLIQARTTQVSGVPVVALCETPFYGTRELRKRSLDLTLATLALLALSPLLLVICVLVKLSSPGPIIFRQRRYGLDGAEITVYKFRTMTVTEDGPHVRQATRDDARVTPLGRLLRRYSLDELPQLVNVIQGRMSLVGPRPHAVAHNEEYRTQVKGYMIRHKVRPGITGLAQVKGFRGETPDIEHMKARIHYDLEYLRNWSIFLDLKIIFLTALGIFIDKKAY